MENFLFTRRRGTWPEFRFPVQSWPGIYPSSEKYTGIRINLTNVLVEKGSRSLGLCGYLPTIQMEEISLAVRESRFTRVWWSVKMLLIRIAEAVESKKYERSSFIHSRFILDSYRDCFCANLSFRITILQSGNILKARWVHLNPMLHTLLRNVYWFVLTSAVRTPVSIFPFISSISLRLARIFLVCG